MKLFRHLKEKRYLILAFTLPALLLALAIVFFRPTHHHAEVGVRGSTKQSSSKAKAPSKSSSSSSSSSSSTSTSSTTSVAASQAQAATTTTVTPAPSSAQGTYQAPQYNYAPPTTDTDSNSETSSYTDAAYGSDISSTVAE